MKILHTADWHLNDSLGRVDRSGEIFEALAQIAVYLEEHRVDVMLVAGDLFSERSRPEQTRAAILRIKELFLPFLARGGTILAISGNHDSEVFFETLRDALDLVAPGKPMADVANASGRLYLAPNPRLVKLQDHNGTLVQFALLPYPTARCYLRGEHVEYSNIEEKHRAVQEAFTRVLKEQIMPQIDVKHPAVLVSHVHVRGAQTHTLYKVSEVEDVVFEPSDIPAHWTYVAYGHIHKAQSVVAGAAHIRYCGSVVPLDFAERHDAKGVELLEIDGSGLKGEIQTLPLKSTPMYHVEIIDPDKQLPELQNQYPDADRALVKYTLHWQPGKHNRDKLAQWVNSIFPRWYARTFVETGRDTIVASYTPQQMMDVVGTVRDYLNTNLHTHSQRKGLIELADALLAEDHDLKNSNAQKSLTPQPAGGKQPQAVNGVEAVEEAIEATVATETVTAIEPESTSTSTSTSTSKPRTAKAERSKIEKPKIEEPAQPALWGDF